MYRSIRKKRRLSQRDDSTDRKKEERLVLAKASVVKEKYRKLLAAHESRWQPPPGTTTHWDCLLSEAMWMWNDFAQEQLWKKEAARRLAYEALQYLKNKEKRSEASSDSADETVTLSKGEVLAIPFCRQFKSGLFDMARRSFRKKSRKFEKRLRKFRTEYENLEKAAVYGFEPDESFSLLCAKIPTQQVMPAPNEEKEYFPAAPVKTTPNKRTSTIGQGNSSRKTSRTKNQLSAAYPSHRHREGDYKTAGESISASELEARQDPLTINDYLAKYDDQLLFYLSAELKKNWNIVSDAMASAKIYMSPSECQEQTRRIETTIYQTQSHLLRPRGPAQPGAGDDVFLKQLKIKAKDTMKKTVPEKLASRFIRHTCSAHKNRCQKMKNALNEARLDEPITYHTSQRHLSDKIVKTIGGRPHNPKESWTKVQSHTLTRILAAEYATRQISAAEAAASQDKIRATSSKPDLPGVSSLDLAQRQIGPNQRPPQLSESLGEVNVWNTVGIPPSFINGAVTGTAPGGHVQTPWMSPTDMFSGFSIPDMTGQPRPPPQQVMGNPGPIRAAPSFGGLMNRSMFGISPDNPIQRVPRPQMPYSPLTVGQAQAAQLYSSQQTPNHQRYLSMMKRLENNPAAIKSFIASSNCTPAMRQMIARSLRETQQARGYIPPQMPGGLPGQLPQRYGGQPGHQGPSRMPQTIASAGDPFAGGVHPGVKTSFPSPMLDHQPHYQPRGMPPVAEFMESQMAPRRPPGFPPQGYPLSDPAMLGINQAGFNSFGLRMHGITPDLVPQPNGLDPRQMFHGQPPDFLDHSQSNPEANLAAFSRRPFPK